MINQKENFLKLMMMVFILLGISGCRGSDDSVSGTSASGTSTITSQPGGSTGGTGTGGTGTGGTGSGGATGVITPQDSDGDGVIDANDNCPAIANPLQEDYDRDLIGNACDNCLKISNFDQKDSNGDGIGDVCSFYIPPIIFPVFPVPTQDMDGDGVSDANDNCPGIYNPNQSDLDRDGIGDVCDWATIFLPPLPYSPFPDGKTTSQKRVFVTFQKYKGSEIGGIFGGDVECNMAAINAGLGGTWKVWLSDEVTDARDRLLDVGPWVRLDGQKVVENKAALLNTASIPLLNPINMDETKNLVDVFYDRVWTGTLSTGEKDINNCKSWWGTGFGETGEANQLDENWTSTHNHQPCGTYYSTYGTKLVEEETIVPMHRLYCFEQ